MTDFHVTTQDELNAALEGATWRTCIYLEGDGEFELSSSDSATVSASGSATVRASGSATVRAYGSATVSGTKYVAVHKHSTYTTITGNPVIIEPQDLLDPTAAQWAEEYGLDVTDGIVIVYKGVDDNYTTSRGADYSPGATPEAADWKPTQECGAGLHFSPSPGHTFAYHPDATRFMACQVKLADLVVLGDKVKAQRVEAPGCVEVDLVGRPLNRTTAQPADAGDDTEDEFDEDDE